MGGTDGSSREVIMDGYDQNALHKCTEHSKNIFKRKFMLGHGGISP